MLIRLDTVCVGAQCRAVPHSPNARQHWATKYRWTAAWKDMVGYALMEKGIRLSMMPERPQITITIYAIRAQDYDNRIASVKAIVDGMKGRAIRDDSPDAIPDIIVKAQKVAHKIDERVEIELPI